MTGRRFEAPERWLENTRFAESKVAFAGRPTILPAQARCRRNQADIGARLAATPGLRRMTVSPTHLLSVGCEMSQTKEDLSLRSR